MAPLLGTAVVLVTGMVFSLWWNQHVDHATVWYEPADLWRTMLAAVRIDHGQIGQIYSNGTNLVSFPGAAVLLAPAAAVISAFHMPLGPPIGTYTDTNAWLVAGPYMMLVSCSALFAADRLAERMGVGIRPRLLLAGAGAVALWNVAPYWGHPEDCVAVALTLFAVDAMATGRIWRSAWLVGAALAVQPLVVLAVPVLAVIVGRRQVIGWLGRAAVLPAIAVGAALAANWSATWYQIVDQPNWPYIDRPTPWIVLAPHLTSQTVAAGPGRSIAVVLAVVACWPAFRAWRQAGGTVPDQPDPPLLAGPPTPAAATSPISATSRTAATSPAWPTSPASATSLASATTPAWPPSGEASAVSGRARRTSPVPPGPLGALWPAGAIASVVWWVALTLALRCAFESVMVSYYIWPGIAVALVAASGSWRRLIPTAALGIGITCFCNVWWHGEWSWWSVIVVTLAAILLASWPNASRARATGRRGASTALATRPDPASDSLADASRLVEGVGRPVT